MAIFRCSKCGYVREVPDQHIGKTAKCQVCQQINPIHNTIAFVKTVVQKYLRIRTELRDLQQSIPATNKIVAVPLSENTDVDIYNTTVMTEKQQYEPIVQWFASRQIEIKVDEKAVDTSGFFDEVAVKLGDNYDLLKPLGDKIKRIQQKSYTNVTLDMSNYNKEAADQIKKFCKELYEYAFVAKYFDKRNEHKIHLVLQTAQPIVDFFKGEWLEWCAFMKLLAFCYERKISFSGLRSFTIHFLNKDKNELDTFFLINKTIPVFVECKSGEFRPFIDKYANLRKRLDIDKAHFLMLVAGLSNEQAQGLTSMFDITFVNEKTFIQHIAKLLT